MVVEMVNWVLVVVKLVSVVRNRANRSREVVIVVENSVMVDVLVE